MNLRRVYAVLLRHLFMFKNDPDTLLEPFLIPTIELFLWGITSKYFQSFSSPTSHFLLIIISGLLLWNIVSQGNRDISIGLMYEIWSKNLINIFVAPLKFSEWIVSLVLLGFIKSLMVLIFAMIIAFALYKIHIFYLGFYLVPFIFLLLMTGWWVGCIASGLILRFGQKFQSFSWTIVLVLSPFSAIYYPMSVLPGWAREISYFVPISYVFEGAREVIAKGTLDPHKLLVSFILNLLYLILAMWFLKASFNKVLDRGLVKLT